MPLPGLANITLTSYERSFHGRGGKTNGVRPINKYQTTPRVLSTKHITYIKRTDTNIRQIPMHFMRQMKQNDLEIQNNSYKLNNFIRSWIGALKCTMYTTISKRANSQQAYKQIKKINKV